MIAQLEHEGKPGCPWWNQAPLSGSGACIRRRQLMLIDSRAYAGR
jgi:hypothetical protein